MSQSLIWATEIVLYIFMKFRSSFYCLYAYYIVSFWKKKYFKYSLDFLKFFSFLWDVLSENSFVWRLLVHTKRWYVWRRIYWYLVVSVPRLDILDHLEKRAANNRERKWDVAKPIGVWRSHCPRVRITYSSLARKYVYWYKDYIYYIILFLYLLLLRV